MVEKIDLKKQWKHLYSPSAKAPSLVEVPAANYLMVDGNGNPNRSQRFKAAIETLYPLAYALKFAVRKQTGIDYGVMPLEGQYWGTPIDQTHFTEEDKEKWSWTLMILQPQWVTEELFHTILSQVKEKKSPLLIDEVRFVCFQEGMVAQIMHIGSFNDEQENVIRLRQLAYQQGYQLAGKHHEIYLNDFNRTAPENLKTVLRQPVSR